MAEQSVSLQPGESKLVSFQAVPTKAQTYQVVVDGLTGSFTATPVPTPSLATLYGRVTDSVIGAPVAGAEVRVLAGAIIKGATTQADGTYLVPDLSPGATIWACLADGYNIITDQPITLVEGNNELNVALTPIGGPPPPPPPGLANFYGIVTNATTATPIAGALVDLSGMPRYTNSTGGFLFQYLTPGQYALTVSKEGYSEFRINLMVAEGNNQYNVNLTQQAPPGAVTIDKFEMMCEFTNGYGVIHTRITLTNHTNQTFIDNTPTGPTGGLVVQMGADAFKAPATDYSGHLGDVFLMRPWDRLGIGSLPPGTHVFSCDLPVQGTHAGPDTDWWAIPWNWFDTYGITEGTRGLVYVFFWAGDERMPRTTFAQAEKNFEGIFSAAWQIWQVNTTWTPPPPPEIPPGPTGPIGP